MRKYYFQQILMLTDDGDLYNFDNFEFLQLDNFWIFNFTTNVFFLNRELKKVVL